MTTRAAASVFLADPAVYAAQITRLEQKLIHTPKYFERVLDGASLAQVVRDQRRVCKLLAHSVSHHTYVFSPCEMRTIVLDKPRQFYAFSILDTLVLGALAACVNERMKTALSPHVYSYRAGISSWTALRAFGTHITHHRRARPDPRERGLYVLRADVKSYAPSIPVTPQSLLWPDLEQLVDQDAVQALFAPALRPLVIGPDGERFEQLIGVPLGSPLATSMLNWYLHDVDEVVVGHAHVATGATNEIFYARFGDDLLIAHSDPEVTLAAEARLESELARKRLRLNDKKRQHFYFTAAGRAALSAAGALWRGTNAITFLGCRIRFDSSVGVCEDKNAELIGELKARLTRSTALLSDSSAAERTAVLCATANAILDPRSPFAHRHATTLTALASDRKQLATLDYTVALTIAQLVTGRVGPRAFRELPYRELRAKAGLRSLVARRNRGLHAARTTRSIVIR